MAQSRTRLQLATSVGNLGFPDPNTGAGAPIVNDFLNEEYKTIAGERRWEWLQVSATFPLVAGTFSYAIVTVTPNDVRNFEALWITDASHNQYQIKYLDPLKLLDLNQDQTAQTIGAPRYWTVYGGNILFYPNPDQAYTATIAYVKSLGDIPLASDTDRPLLPGDYDTVLVWGAAAMQAARMKDWLGRDFMLQQRDHVLGNMRADYSLKQRQNSDEVEQTGIWGHPYGSNSPIWS